MAVVLGAVLTVFAIPAYAQNGKVDREAIATCVMDNAPRAVRTLLNTVPGSPAETAAAKPVLDYYGGCDDNRAVQGALGWNDRAEIARAALAARIGGRSRDLSQAATVSGWRLAVVQGAGGYDPTAVEWRRIGDCTVAAAPADALKLALASEGSSDERQALASLAPVLNRCVVAGQNLRLKRQSIRLLVAEPLYHLVSR